MLGNSTGVCRVFGEVAFPIKSGLKKKDKKEIR
jgi:hypothetical protein